jgi:predicted Holliday junction resolvase-like endonuclease
MPIDPELVRAFLAGALVAAIITSALLLRRASRIRSAALASSRAVLRGQISEQIAPLLEDFPWDSADARFLGHPIDFVVFDGLAADEEELEIVLVEVKTGGGRLTRREAAVRDAVEAGRVRFEIVRI